MFIQTHKPKNFWEALRYKPTLSFQEISILLPGRLSSGLYRQHSAFMCLAVFNTDTPYKYMQGKAHNLHWIFCAAVFILLERYVLFYTYIGSKARTLLPSCSGIMQIENRADIKPPRLSDIYISRTALSFAFGNFRNIHVIVISRRKPWALVHSLYTFASRDDTTSETARVELSILPVRDSNLNSIPHQNIAISTVHNIKGQ